MRRIALATTLLLSGCGGSGFYAYLGNTFTIPGANPNIPHGNAENYIKVRANPRVVELPPPVLLNEAGDIWPGPPVPPPTLRDLQKQQNQQFSGQGNYAPLQPLPELPGYDVPNQPTHVNPPPSSLPGSMRLPAGNGLMNGPASGAADGGTTSNGSIIVPNGNGTSTVIGPNGTVSTIPTPGK
jgi:hypothetical protein